MARHRFGVRRPSGAFQRGRHYFQSGRGLPQSKTIRFSSKRSYFQSPICQLPIFQWIILLSGNNVKYMKARQNLIQLLCQPMSPELAMAISPVLAMAVIQISVIVST
jgi:hypothetical protein